MVADFFICLQTSSLAAMIQFLDPRFSLYLHLQSLSSLPVPYVLLTCLLTKISDSTRALSDLIYASDSH